MTLQEGDVPRNDREGVTALSLSLLSPFLFLKLPR